MKISKSVWYMGINLAYIILTVFLIFRDAGDLRGTYRALNSGLERSIDFIDDYNVLVKKSIFKSADDYPNPMSSAYKQKYITADSLVNRFCGFLDSTSSLISKEIELDIKSLSLNTFYSNKSFEIDRILLTSQEGKRKSIATLIEFRIKTLLDSLKGLYDNDPATQNHISLNLKYPTDGKLYRNWPDYIFNDVSIYNVYSTLLKLKIEAKSSLSDIGNYIDSKLGGDCICFDSYKLIFQPDQLSAILGENLTAKMRLATYSSSLSKSIINANGVNLSIKSGVAKYQAAPKSIGRQIINLTGSLLNPTIDSIERISATYSFDVLERSIVVNNPNNFIYTSFENLIILNIPGIDYKNLTLKLRDPKIGTIKNNNPNKYVLKLKESTASKYCDIKIEGDNLKSSKRLYIIPFPLPIVKISGLETGSILTEDLKSKNELSLLNYKDIPGNECKIIRFTLSRFKKNNSYEKLINYGAQFSFHCKELIMKADKQDVFIFDKIIAKCHGSKKERYLNSLVFNIK